MQHFSKLVGRIYDTIIDPTRWSDVLGSMCAYVEAARATLILEDAVEPARSAFHASYSDSEWLERYFQTYMLLNPMRLLGFGRIFAGDVVLTSDLISPDHYARSRFSREFLSRRDIVDIAVAVLDQSATTITVLSFKRDLTQGFADEAVRRKIGLIAPHVARAMAIGRVFETKGLEVSTLSATLDTLAGAVFLLDGSGTVVHANASAASLLAEGDILRQVGGVLVPKDAAAKAALAEALPLADAGDEALGTRGTSILFSSRPDKVMLGTLMPLTTGARRPAGQRFHAVAALCVRETSFAVPSQAAKLAEVHGLTAREFAVLLAIVEHGGVPEVAAVLGLSEATVKGHLKSVFIKTASKRQADLVKLVAGMAGPMP